MKKTFEYRIYPNKGQKKRMEEQLFLCSQLYNVMLEQRRDEYRAYGLSVSRYDQEKQISELRTIPEYGEVYCHVLQDVAKRVDLAFAAFFRRIKRGDGKPGFPRFRSSRRYDSLTYKQPGNGCIKVENNRVSFSKLAENVRMFQHRPLRGDVRSVTVKRRGGKWFVQFSCDNVPPAPDLAKGVGEIGIDVGLTHFATLSNGEQISNPRYGKKAQFKLGRAHRVLSRRKKGSNRRRKQIRIVAKQYDHIRNQRRNHAFKTARNLVTRFDTIAVEDLIIKNMVRNRRLARSIQDAAWGTFLNVLEIKAEEAGCLVLRVNPRGTSQECSACGTIVKKKLSTRTHDCPECGLVLDRDHNAAINIMNRARTEPSWRVAVA